MENEEMLEDAGRATDDAMGHLTTGEIVIPLPMLEDPQVMEMLNALFADAQMNIAEFTVGDPANKINPETGYPEFFSFKKAFSGRGIAKALTSFDPIGILPSGIRNTISPIVESLAPAVLSGINPAIGGAYTAAQSYGKGNSIGNSLLKGGAAYGLGELGSAVAGGDSILSGTQLGDKLGSIGDIFAGSQAAGPNLSGGAGYRVGGLGDAFKSIGGSSSSGAGSVGASAGGGSTFSGANLANIGANIIGGLQQDSAIKKQQKQLLGANAEQLANLETFNPADITSQPNYEFQRAQGQEGLNKQLAASGALGSGRAIKAATEYNQNYANNAFQQAYQNWLQKTQLKNQAIGAAGDVRANATGAGSQNIAQSLSNAIGGKVGQYGGSSGLTPEQLKALLGN